MRAIKILSGLVGLSTLGLSLVAAPAQADTTNWAVSSAYSFPSTSTMHTDNGTNDETISRVTFSVPGAAKTLYYDLTGGDTEQGFVTPSNGFAVIDITEPSGQAFQPVNVNFSNSQGGTSVWSGAVSTVTPASATKLTMNVVADVASAGSTTPVSGTLTGADGKGLTGQYVELGDFRRSKCVGAVGYCGQFYMQLGSAKVDSTGHWKTSVPVRWTEHMVASYCEVAAGCWLNANRPVFTIGRTVTAKWAPKLKLPTTPVHKGYVATYTVTVPTGQYGTVIRVQALLGGVWRTVASSKITTYLTVHMPARLPVAGKVRMRAFVPKFTSSIQPGQTVSTIVVNSGNSVPTTITVTR